MTDWVERYHQQKRAEEASKGGPGSGHHGHAGRPGKVGGSAPGKGVPKAGKPIIPTRTRVYTLIEDEGIIDPEELVQAVGIDEQWVRDIVKDELARMERRRRPGIYVPAAVSWVTSLDSEFKVEK